MQEDYEFLPKRVAKSDGSFKKQTPAKFETNYYDLKIDYGRKIYQYSIELKDIPDDSGLYKLAVKSIKDKLKDEIDFLFSKGQMMWGNKPCKLVLTKTCKFKHKEK